MTLPAAWVPLLRLCFLLGSFVTAFVLFLTRRPSPAALRTAVVAGGVQLWLAVILDGLCVAAGLWRYPDPGPAVWGVPLDLHIAWALLYGVGLSLAAPAAPAERPRFALIVWAATWCIDGLCVPKLGALCQIAPGLGWIAADGALLAVLIATTMWLHGQVLGAGSGRGLIGRAAIYMAAFGSITLLYLPSLLLRLGGVRPWPPPVGIGGGLALGAGLLVAVVLGAWAVWAFVRGGGTPLPFDPPRRLVTWGPYAYLRNPMQLSGVLCALLFAAAYRAPLLFVYALDLVLISEIVFVRHEEPQLLDRFGADYAAYRAAVPRWLPRLGPVWALVRSR